MSLLCGTKIWRLQNLYIFLSCLTHIRIRNDTLPVKSLHLGQCRHLVFGAEQAFKGKRLVNHLIRIHDVMNADFCGSLCYMEHNCASYNLMRRSEAEGHKCELNNSTHEGNEHDLVENPNYVYRGTKVTMIAKHYISNIN